MTANKKKTLIVAFFAYLVVALIFLFIMFLGAEKQVEVDLSKQKALRTMKKQLNTMVTHNMSFLVTYHNGDVDTLNYSFKDNVLSKPYNNLELYVDHEVKGTPASACLLIRDHYRYFQHRAKILACGVRHYRELYYNTDTIKEKTEELSR